MLSQVYYCMCIFIYSSRSVRGIGFSSNARPFRFSCDCGFWQGVAASDQAYGCSPVTSLWFIFCCGNHDLFGTSSCPSSLCPLCGHRFPLGDPSHTACTWPPAISSWLLLCRRRFGNGLLCTSNRPSSLRPLCGLSFPLGEASRTACTWPPAISSWLLLCRRRFGNGVLGISKCRLLRLLSELYFPLGEASRTACTWPLGEHIFRTNIERGYSNRRFGCR